jgi:hypothetical protein
LFVCLLGILFFNTKAQLVFSEEKIDLGTVPSAYEIKGTVTLTNTAAKKVFLLRADADPGLKIYTSKKTLAPNDTCLLSISFVPEKKGRFEKQISLIASDQNQAHQIILTGSLNKLTVDNKQDCYVFGTNKNKTVSRNQDSYVEMTFDGPRNNNNKIPDPTKDPMLPPPPPIQNTNSNEKTAEEALPAALYKPNNILFLVDVSGSMKDSLKLPLLKNAMYVLIKAVRPIDRITLVSYSDSVVILKEGIIGSDKKTLFDAVNGLKAKGLTKGNKAILFSQVLAQKHFINVGNNQIFLATDGKFRFNPEDFKKWTERQQNKKITLSSIGFGNDKVAIKNLKEIAEKGEGSFIHINKRDGADRKLLDEIKERSRIH